MPRPAPVSSLVADLLTKAPDLSGHEGRPYRLAGLPPKDDRHAAHDTQGQSARNFGVQDYLALAADPRLRAAAMAARVAQAGIAGSLVTSVEEKVARLLHLPDAIAFASGTDAIRASLQALVSPGDSVILDAGANSAMFETVFTSQARLLRSPPGSVEGVERRLHRLFATRPQGRVWVAVPAVSAFASTVADLTGLSALCRHYGAGLIVDVSHDLGAMGSGGGGVIELQGCRMRADLVVGSFAKTFGAAGGFAAFRDPVLKARILARTSQSRRTIGLSPTGAATILAAFEIILGTEGRDRRQRLLGNSLRLRNHLMAEGLPAMGQPSPFVPLRLAAGCAVSCTTLLESAGLVVGLIQAPLVGRHSPRWRLTLSADHDLADIDDLADLIRDVTRILARSRTRVRV